MKFTEYVQLREQGAMPGQAMTGLTSAPGGNVSNDPKVRQAVQSLKRVLSKPTDATNPNAMKQKSKEMEKHLKTLQAADTVKKSKEAQKLIQKFD